MNKKKKSLNRTLLITSLLAVVLMGVGIYIYLQNRQQTPLTEQQTLQRQEQEQAEKEPKPSSESQQRQANQGQDAGVNPTITSLGQSGSTIYVSAIVESQKTGNCTLELTQAGSPTITKSAPVGLVSSYYACQGFNIERSAFAKPGNWSAIVRFEGNGKSGSSERKSLTVE